jgi:hypothetical protein
MREVAPMPEAGYRLRVERMLADTLGKKTALSFRKRLAEWIARRLKQKDGMEITGLRIRRALWRTNTPELNFPRGHWERGLDTLPATTQISTLAEYAIVNGTAIVVQARPKGPAGTPQPKIFRRENTSKPAGKA